MRSEWTNLRYFSVRRSLARNSHDSPGGESDFVDRSVRVSGLMICWRTRWVVCWPPLPQMAIESAGRSRRGVLAGLRYRGLRPAHSCGVEAQRLLLAIYTCLFGLYPNSVLHYSLRPQVARASRPPLGWLRHSAVLVSSRRAADPVPLGTRTGQSIPSRENCPRAGQAPRARGGRWAASANPHPNV